MATSASTGLARLACLLIAIGGGACGARPSERAANANASRDARSQAAGLPSFAVGTTREYHLELSSNVRIAANAPPVDFTLRARFTVTPLVVPRGSGAIDEALQVRVLDAEPGSSTGDAAAFAGLVRELAAGFLLERSTGSVRSLRMAPNASAFAVSIARTLGAELQLGGSEGTTGTWSATESDATGTYRVEYQRLAKPETFSKKKRAYDALELKGRGADGARLSVAPEVVESEGRLELVGGGLQALTYREKLKTRLLGSGEAVAETSLSMNFTRDVPAQGITEYAALRASTTDHFDAVTGQDQRKNNAELERSRIGDFTFESAIAELAQLNGSGPPLLLADSSRETPAARALREQRLVRNNRAFSALSAILASDESSVPRALAELAQHPDARSFVLDALASAGSASTQAALLRMTDDASLSESIRQRAVASIIRIKAPSPATVQALLGWLGERSRRGTSAIYGLGTMVRLLRAAGQTALAEQVSQALGERLRRTTDGIERTHLLRGIANTGDAALLSDVLPLLTSPDASLRGAAALALRLMTGPNVDQLLAERILKEQSAVALLDAIDAAKPRAPSSALSRALSEVALHSADSQARYRSVKLLGSWADSEPEVRPVLSQVALHDAAEDVRRAAQSAAEKS